MKSRSRKRLWLVIGFAFMLSTLKAGAESTPFWKEAPASGKAVSSGAPGSFASLAEQAMPAVVTVYSKKNVTGIGPFFLPREFVQEGAGSGFIISADGYILTNNHVVTGSDSITVVVGVGQRNEFPAKLIGSDPDIDVALVKIEQTGLPVLPLGNSDALRVGDWVAAIGSPFNYPHTLTVGVVSAKGRRLGLGNYDDFIQTDASINPGNSGGPLINMRGEVVGINTLIVSPSRGNVGIGFATPINLVKTILPQIRETGKVTRSWLGVTIMPVTEELAKDAGMEGTFGAYVTQVVIGSPADKAGIDVGDIIIEFNGQRIKDSHELPTVVSSFGVGRKADLVWVHQGERISRQVELGKLPDPKEQVRLKVRGETQMDNILGVAVRDLGPEDREKLGLSDLQGVLVVEVAADGAAAMNDIQPGDIITKINLAEIRKVDDFNRIIKTLMPGSYVRINLQRGEALIFRVFKLPRP